MSLLVARGDFQMTTDVATTVLQIRGVGFQGKALEFWWNGRDSAVDASGEASHRAGFGFATDATSRACIAHSSLHGAADSGTDRYGANDACIATIVPGAPGTLEGKADFLAWHADGFDLIIDDAFATAFQVHFKVRGGSDITDATVVSFQSPAAPGDQDVEVGFEPNYLSVLTASLTSAVAISGEASVSIGFASSPADQFVQEIFASDGAATTLTRTYTRRDDLIAVQSTSIRAALATWLPEGFRLTWSEAWMSIWCFALAIKGGRYKVKGLSTSITGAASIVDTGVGFPPKAVTVVSSCKPEDVLNTFSTPGVSSIGCATGAAAQAAVQWQDKTASATTDVFTALDYNQVYVNASVDATQVVEGLMALASFDADGATYTMTDGDPIASFAGVIYDGDTVPGSVEDEAGLIYQGAPIRYVDPENYEVGAFLESASAAFGNTVDLAVLRAVGSSLTKVSVTSVPHWSVSGRAPYWTRY